MADAQITRPGEAAHGDGRGEERGATLERLAVAYYDRLVGFVRKRGAQPDEAVDLAQETFERLSAADVQSVRAPRAFLYTTILNLMRDHSRSAATRYIVPALTIPEHNLISAMPIADQVLSDKQQAAILEAAILELPSKCQEALVLYRFDELSQKEIAARLGVSISMVGKYLRQALRHCEQRLTEANGEMRVQGEQGE